MNRQTQPHAFTSSVLTVGPRRLRPQHMNRPAVAGPGGNRLHGSLLSRSSWLLVAAGTGGGLLFTGVYLTEGALRAGYSPLGEPVSALSLGPGGWVQRINFAVFGVLLALSAAGWRSALHGGRGAALFPLLRGAAGLGLIMDGLFSQDPGPGYPPGTASTAATVTGTIHTLFAFVTITALAASCFVLARRFAAEPGWQGWPLATALAGLLTIVFIAAFGALGAHGGITGLLERLAGGVNSLLGLAVLTRLLYQYRAARRPGVARAAQESH